MRKERAEIISVLFDISDFSNMTAVKIQKIICYNLVNTFLSKVVYLSCLNLKNGSLLFGCIYFRMLWIYVNCSKKRKCFLMKDMSHELKYT